MFYSPLLAVSSFAGDYTHCTPSAQSAQLLVLFSTVFFLKPAVLSDRTFVHIHLLHATMLPRAPAYEDLVSGGNESIDRELELMPTRNPVVPAQVHAVVVLAANAPLKSASRLSRSSMTALVLRSGKLPQGCKRPRSTSMKNDVALGEALTRVVDIILELQVKEQGGEGEVVGRKGEVGFSCRKSWPPLDGEESAIQNVLASFDRLYSLDRKPPCPPLGQHTPSRPNHSLGHPPSLHSWLSTGYRITSMPFVTCSEDTTITSWTRVHWPKPGNSWDWIFPGRYLPALDSQQHGSQASIVDMRNETN
ncbi:ste ste20 paka protein kinase [Moniliophthora roreri]|nr:ste ste20 paka protein kinase [Moniliophthora roreri]